MNGTDQVVRLNVFRKEHPAVEIISPRQQGRPYWVAVWDEENGSTQVTQFELRDLLDELGRRFA